MSLLLRRLILLLALTVPGAFGAYAAGSISGKIIDARSAKPVEGVDIYLKELNLSAVTDAFGMFRFNNIPAGTYTLDLLLAGYKRRSETVTVPDGGPLSLIYTLNPGEVKLNDVTVNAQREINHSTISLIDLKLRPINTAQDMMRLVPGVFLSQHQGGGKAEQMFLRGFDLDHGTDINVSVDDVPVNMVSHAHGQGYADLHFLIPELIDKMEFGKGPYTIDKGNLATAGWAAFKTKSYLDNSFVKLEGGTYGYFRMATAIDLLGERGKKRRASAYIAGEYGYNRSYFDKPQDFSRINLTGKYTKQFGEGRLFSATLSGFHSGWSASGQLPARAIREGIVGRFGELDKEGGLTSRYQLNLQYTQALKGNASFRANAYAGYYDFSLYSNFTFFLLDTVNGDQIHQAEQRIFAGFNASYSKQYNIGKLAARTEAGAGLRSDNIDGSELSHTVDRTFLNYIRYGDIHETNLFGYINETVHLLPQLAATAGARYDYLLQRYDNRMPSAGQATYAGYRHGAFSPKLGLYYNISSTTRFYANYGVGFHSNDARDIYFRPEAGNDVLPLEHAADLGILVKPIPTLLLQAAVFRMDLEEEYTYPGDAGDQPQLNGKTRRMGVDFSGRYEASKWLYFDADFNYTHARYVDAAAGDNYVELAPRLTSVGGVTMKAHRNLSLSLRYRYMGDRPANTDKSIIAPGYTLADLTATYSRGRYELGLQIQNLTNTAWNEAAFATTTRLKGEAQPVEELCFTPGTPLFAKLSIVYRF